MKSKIDDQSVSLSDVHRSVALPKGANLIRRILAFAGPAYLVSVGYMDPGNWATDLEGGARFGYTLIWVLLMSNLMAVLLQTLAARLGIVTGRDLAQACRDSYPRSVSMMLWGLGEIAIAACDLAEVLGTAIGLNLLVGIPLLWGVILTGLDTMLFLAIQHLGIRKMEAFVLSLVTVIGACFFIEVFFSKPAWSEIMRGFTPVLSRESLFIAIGILGATVMPHNLYLHSALVQTRDFEQTEEGKKSACRLNFIDTALALNAAFFVNAAILIVAAAVFHAHGIVVTEIQQAHQLLSPLVGTALASTLFAVALISSGQSSTITGTLAGQIVMEGFVHLKIRPVIRRIITRLLAIVPAVLVIILEGDRGTYPLLILSQVVLSLQLPFAVVPLIRFTADKQKMGSFANPRWVNVLAWVAAFFIIALNGKLIFDTVLGWMANAGLQAVWVWLIVVPFVAACSLLLFYLILPGFSIFRRKVPIPMPPALPEIPPAHYHRIGVSLDFSPIDVAVLANARTMATQHGAAVILYHVVEGTGGQVFGTNAFDLEAREDKAALENIASRLRETGLRVEVALGYGRVASQLIRLSMESQIDMLIMGGHRHKWWGDLIFGTSVSKVRHALSIPVLVVQK